MNQLEHPPTAAETESGSRRQDYVEWRQRLADKQEELRNLDEPDLGPVLDPRWSPEALFTAGDVAPEPDLELGPAEGPTAELPPGTLVPAAVVTARAPVSSGAEAAPNVAKAPRAPVAPKRAPRPTPTAAVAPAPATADPAEGATVAPTTDAAWPRGEVRALLRIFRANAGSPRTTAPPVHPASRSGLVEGRGSVDRGPVLVRELAGGSDRGADQPEIIPSPTVPPVRRAPSVGDELRALNRLRVDGEVSDDEFKRRKRELFIRSSAPRAAT